MNKGILLKKKDLTLFTILFFLLMPQTLKVNDLVNMIIYQGTIALAFALVIICCLRRKSFLLGSAIILTRIGYSIAQLYSTKLAGYPISVDVHDSFTRICTLIIVFYYLQKYKKQFICVLSNLLILFLYINLATIVITKNFGGNHLQMYFLGYRYQFCPIVMLTLALSTALDYMDYNKMHYRSYLSIFSSILTILIEGPSTLLAGVIVFVLFIYIMQVGKKININTYWIIFAFIIAVDILITVLNADAIFSWFVTNILHRDMSFTGRTEVWASAIYTFINSNIWLGNGLALATGKDGWASVWGSYYSEHNHYLGILTNGGILCIALEGLFYVLVIHKISKKCQSNENIIVAASFFSILVMGIGTQIIPFIYMEILGLIAYYFNVVSTEEKII